MKEESETVRLSRRSSTADGLSHKNRVEKIHFLSIIQSLPRGWSLKIEVEVNHFLSNCTWALRGMLSVSAVSSVPRRRIREPLDGDKFLRLLTAAGAGRVVLCSEVFSEIMAVAASAAENGSELKIYICSVRKES